MSPVQAKEEADYDGPPSNRHLELSPTASTPELLLRDNAQQEFSLPRRGGTCASRPWVDWLRRLPLCRVLGCEGGEGVIANCTD